MTRKKNPFRNFRRRARNRARAQARHHRDANVTEASSVETN